MLNQTWTSRTRVLSVVIALTIVQMSACSTAARYKKHEQRAWGDASGYETRKTGEDSYYIVYYLKSSLPAGGMSLRQLEINTFYRAAEVTKEQNKSFFILTNFTDYELSNNPYAPELTKDGITYLGGSHSLLIRVFSTAEEAKIAVEKEVHKFVYNASEVLNRLGPHMIF